jgi:catechol 1,2-dioxygenase
MGNEEARHNVALRFGTGGTRSAPPAVERAALGRGVERAPHLHFMVSAPGYDTVITHIFRPDCPFLEVDAVFGVKESLIADFRKVTDAKRAAELGFTGAPFFWDVKWDFVLAHETGKQAFVHQV